MWCSRKAIKYLSMLNLLRNTDCTDHTDAHGYDRSVFRIQSKGENKCFTPNQQIKSLIHFSKSITHLVTGFWNDRKERFESETPNPCVSVESVSSVFPSV